MRKLSPDDVLDRLQWRREIRNVMGRVSHDYAVKQEADVYSRYWSGREDVCLGLNIGWYKGAEAVKGYYKALGDEIALSSSLIQKRYPDELGKLTSKEVYGVGMMTYLPFDSQVIEISTDGQTAKGIWNVRGSYCRLTGSGPVSNWIFGWAAVDFVHEGGDWKIWHMQLVYNVDHQCGTGFCDEPKQFDKVDTFAPIDDFRLPEPNVKQKIMEHFHPARAAAGSPKCPEPYDTFADAFSYGL